MIILATVLGDVKTYKRLTLTFKDGLEKSMNLSIDNPKNVGDGDYVDVEAQDAALDTAMNTILSANIFHNNGEDLTVAYNAREIDYSSKDVKD